MAEILSQRNKDELVVIVKKIFQENKGILSLDQSNKYLDTFFKPFCLENNPHNRRRYREIYLTANPKFTKAISGVLLSEEGFYQRGKDGKLFRDILKGYNIAVGVRIDNQKQNNNVIDETQDIEAFLDLENLPARLITLKISGCDFAKVHVRLHMSRFTESFAHKNSEMLSLFASLCQKVAILPVLVITGVHKGNHDLERGKNVLDSTISTLKATLFRYNVYMRGLIIALPWVMSGEDCPTKYTTTQMAEATHDILLTNLVPAMYGIMFVSSTDAETTTTEVLNEIVKLNSSKKWRISFLFCRAFQESAINTWHGRDERIPYAQNEFLIRIRANYLALQGKYHDFLMLKNPYTPPAEPAHHYDDLFEDDEEKTS